MTRNKILIALFILSFAVTLHATTYSVWTGSPSGMATGKGAMEGYPKNPPAWATTSISNVATTTAQIVTALAGRKKIEFFMNDAGIAGVTWIHIGSTTASVGVGVPICNSAATLATGTSIIRSHWAFDVDAGVPVSYICTTAAAVCVLQVGQLPGE